MPTEIIAALIALSGVVFSIVGSLIATTRATNIELQKLRTEIQQTYADRLLEKRLEVYPELYAYLSDFIKVIRFSSVTKDSLEKLHSQVMQWDSRHSILFTARTGVIFHHFYMLLMEMVKLSDMEIRGRFSSEEEKKRLRHALSGVELALKSDLGIYVVEFADLSKVFTSYQEVVDSVRLENEG